MTLRVLNFSRTAALLLFGLLFGLLSLQQVVFSGE
jgi:hypothetical protein